MCQKFSPAEAGEAAVVFTVNTAVPLPPAARFTLAASKLQVGALCPAGGEAIREQVRFSDPEYVLPPVNVTFPVALAPGETGDNADADITN
jgi:hypothetical protein